MLGGYIYTVPLHILYTGPCCKSVHRAAVHQPYARQAGAGSPSEKCAGGVPNRCVKLLSSLYCTMHICTPCTPCWTGVSSGELTLLDFIAQTESKYLKHRASKDITLLEIWWTGLWPVLLLQRCEVKCVLAVKRRKVFNQVCGVYDTQYSGCMYARHDGTRHEMTWVKHIVVSLHDNSYSRRYLHYYCWLRSCRRKRRLDTVSLVKNVKFHITFESW